MPATAVIAFVSLGIRIVCGLHGSTEGVPRSRWLSLLSWKGMCCFGWRDHAPPVRWQGMHRASGPLRS
eukprot:353436-Chlamydomonas_euryale.AAC.12